MRNGWRLGLNLALMARVGGRTGDALVDTVTVCGENLICDRLERELHVAMASFHFGLWEYLPRVFSRSGCRVMLAVGKQRDRVLGRQISALRRSRRVTLVRGIRQAVKAGSESSITGFMLDNTSRGTQVWTECDGVKIRLPDVGFRLAARHGNGLAPAFARLDRGRIRVDVYPPGREQAAARALLDQVRRYPEECMKDKVAPHKLSDELCIIDDSPKLSGGVKIKKFGQGGLAELAEKDESRQRIRKVDFMIHRSKSTR